MAGGGPRVGEVTSVADPGEGPGGAPSLFLDQTEARRADKKYLRPPFPP